MIYIEKTNEDAITFVNDFLYSNWLDQGDGNFRYQNIDYASVKNPVNIFRGFFVNDQNNRCCYCCRNIDNNYKTELEHIIPRTKYVQEEFEPYYDLSIVLRSNVIPQSVFEVATVRLTTPPFPHHIAYHNIVASCNGRTFESSENFTCCNRKREDDFIPPFNLMLNPIQYLPDGTIVYQRDVTNRHYFEVLNLSKDMLVNIRRLWYLFSQSTLVLEQILDDSYTPAINEKIVLYAIANSPTPAEDNKLVETFSNSNVWTIFKEYTYFFEYYRRAA